MGRVAFYGLPDPKFFTDNITQNKLRFPKILGLYLYYCRIVQYRLLTNLFMEKQYVKLHNNGQASVFAISNRGAGGEAPCKKKTMSS